MVGLRVKFKFKPSHKDFVPKKESKIKSLFWSITNNCSHKCTFCCVSGGPPKSHETTLHEDLNLIKQISETGIKVVTISGGEPLLSPKLLPILKELNNHNVKIKLCTNGYFLTNDILDKLLRYNVSSIQLSLNSINKDSYYKITQSPTGSFEKTLAAIDKITQASNLHTILSAVPLKTNKDELPSMLEFVKNKEIDTFSLYKLIPTGRSQEYKSDILDEPEFINILDNLLQNFFQDRKKSWLVEAEIPYFPFSKLQEKYKNKNINTLPCRAAEYFVGITSDGHITPCPALDYPEFYCGNIKNEKLSNILTKSNIIRDFHKIDSDCKHAEMCRGGCKAATYGLTRSTKTCDPYCSSWLK